MQSQIAANRRLFVLYRILNQNFHPITIRKCSSGSSVNIGDVTKPIRKAQHPEYVPRKYCKFIKLLLR